MPAIETLSDANKRVFAKAGMQLPVVAISDAAVAMVANTRYEGSIFSFTANRNYTLPAGTAGDVIEVMLTGGSDSHEIILLGATGVGINGGSKAVEWSRLFISNEYVRFRCGETNDWYIEVDGRRPMEGILVASTTAAITADQYNVILFDTASGIGNVASHSNDRFTARRACHASGLLRWISVTNPPRQTIMAVTKNGTTTSPDTRIYQGIWPTSTGIVDVSGGTIPWRTEAPLAVGDTIHAIVYCLTSALTAVTDVQTRPLFTFQEILT